MNSPTPAIQIENLTYAYGRAEAVHDLSLTVQPGRCYGLFGRNGAGKTTTMKCLLNLLRPQRGQVRVFGLDPAKHEVEVKRLLSYVPDQVIEGLAHAHPRIECHLVRHVREAAFHLHFVLCRIETEHAHLPMPRAEQIEQALHGGRLARAVAPEECVTTTGLHAQAQVVHRLRAPVSVSEILDLDGGSERVHGRSILLRVFMGAPFVVQHIQSFMDQFEEFIAGHLQMVCLHNGLVDLFDQQLAPDFLSQCRLIFFQVSNPAPAASRSRPGFPARNRLWRPCCG